MPARTTWVACLTATAVALITLAMSATTIAQPTCTINWDGGAGTNSWHDAANWDRAGADDLPGATDHACIPTAVIVEVSEDAGSVLTVQSLGTLLISGGSLSLTDTVEPSVTANLTHSGGTLGGTGTVTISGTYDWTGGTQAGDGGTTVIASGATLTVTGTTQTILDTGRTLQINSGATATLGASAILYMNANAQVQNAGTFNANGNTAGTGILFNTGSVSGQLFHNTGTFTRNGTGVFAVTAPFDNDGTVNASAGTLQLHTSDAGTTTGSFNGSGTNGLVEFSSGIHELQANATLSGRITLTNATLNVNASVPFSAGGTFTQTGGTLGGTGTLTISGTYDWTGGTQAGDGGTTVIASGATLTVTGTTQTILDTGRTLQINSGATATLGASAILYMNANAQVQNAGTFNANGDETAGAGILFNTGSVSGQLFHNTGTFTRNGTGVFAVTAPFDNDGTVNASAGTLSLGGGGGPDSGTGSFNAAAGAVVDFSGGTFNLSGPTTSGAGTVQVSGATVNFSGTYNVGGTTLISGGVANFNSAGTVNDLTHSGGTLGGTGTVTISGTYDWTGGTQAGDGGTTVIASGATLTVTGTTQTILDTGRTLQINSGATATLGASAILYMNANAQVQNAGTFNANGNTAGTGILFNTGSVSGQLFHNTGTFTRNGTGVFAVTAPFDNDGTVNASAGTLQLHTSDAGTTTGSFNGSGTNGLVEFSSGIHELQANATLSGRITLTNATLNVNASVPFSAGGTFTQTGGTLGGTGTLTISGTYDWTGGTQAGDGGTTVIASGATLTVTGTTQTILDTGRTLQINSGATATLGASAILYMNANAQVQNAGTFNANGDETAGAGILFNTGSVSGQLFHNTGTFTRNGTGVFAVTAPFDNDGTVEVATGILGVGSYTQSAGATLHLHVGGLTPGTGFTQLDGSGPVALAGTLRITTESGFTPTLGQTFRIVNASPRTGEFSTLVGADAGGGLTYTVQYDATGADLVVGNNPNPDLSVDDVSVLEGDTPTTTTLTFTASLDAVASGPVTVDYATADDSASAPADYTATSGTLTIPAGATTATVVVTVIGDDLVEGNESFNLNLTNASGANLLDGLGVGTIIDDDEIVQPPDLSVDDVSVLEGDTPTTTTLTFTASLDAVASGPVTVDYATADDSASAPADYTATSGTLTIPAGATTATVVVTVIGDDLVEGNESFNLNLTNASGANLLDGLGVGTIIDDDEIVQPPDLSVDDVSVLEGDTPTTTTLTFTASLDAVASGPVTVDYATADDSASAPADYTATSGTLTIPAGATTATVVVTVIGDDLVEGNESFNLNLTNASGANLLDGLGVGTIIDDDEIVQPPDLSVDDVSVLEGDTPTTTTLTFTASLDAVASGPVTVDYATADDSASAPADYTATSGTLTIPAGATTATVVVTVIGDDLVEGNESFNLNLTNASGANLLDGLGVGTIIDDDEIVQPPDLSVDDVSVLEGDTPTTTTLTFTASLDAVASGPVTVDYATADDSASAPADYTATSGTLTIPAGATTATVVVTVIGDDLVEGNESFNLNLTNASGANLLDGLGVGTIIDDDEIVQPPDLSVDDVSVLEGDTPTTTTLTFTASLDAVASGPVTVDYATADDSASAPADYTATSGTLTIPAGATTATVVVTVIGDDLVEGNESFNLNLTNASGANLLDGLGVGTIIDDDETPPPATVALSPESDTNAVGDEHCVVATVEDTSGNPVAGVTVRFSVTGANPTSGSATTNSTGQATFCYTGDSTGDDAITAFADTNGNGDPDSGEPAGEATKTWIDEPPPGMPGCEVEGEGKIKTLDGDWARFDIDVESGAQPKGKLFYRDNERSLKLRSTSITDVLVSSDGRRATVRGTGTIEGAGMVEFEVDLQDLPRADDTFQITLSNGYESGERRIRNGDADIECKCEIRTWGKIEALNGDKATFWGKAEALPPKGSLSYRDHGPAQPLRLKWSKVTEVLVSADERQASIIGTARVEGGDRVDFRADLQDLPGAPDTFRIQAGTSYDSGERPLTNGDVDIDCGDDRGRKRHEGNWNDHDGDGRGGDKD